MDWYKPFHRIEREETDDSLTFLVVPQHCWMELVVVAGLAAAGIAVLIVHFAYGVFILFGAIMFSWSRMAASPSSINATRKGMYADGQLHPWNTIRELSYRSDGENGPSGFALVGTGWQAVTWINTDVDSSETEDIIRAIYTKFWDAEMAPRPDGLLEKLRSAPLTLGLSTPEAKRPLH